MTAQAQEWRHQLHRIPETGFEETATAEAVARILTELGIEFVSGVGGTGIVATLTRGGGSTAIGLRADMDALPIGERTGLAYASQTPGVMHACGHDGHMAMLLGAASRLADDGGFDGTVHLVFQPAEEHGRGAQAMLDDGLLDRFPMQQMFGLHNVPGVPVGHFHTRVGELMASEDDFVIRVHGRGGHASRPNAVIDPIVVAAEIIVALQTIVARSVDPSMSAVVSCTEVHTDGARNAIPSEVVISGDTRSFAPVVQALLERRMRELCAGIAAAHGATVDVEYTHEFAPTVNDAIATRAAVSAARTALGPDRVLGDCLPWMASEDFGVFARAVPSCFAFIGNGTELGRGGTPLHSHDYDFNDDALAAGIDYYVALVRQQLPEGGHS